VKVRRAPRGGVDIKFFLNLVAKYKINITFAMMINLMAIKLTAIIYEVLRQRKGARYTPDKLGTIRRTRAVDGSGRAKTCR
jgi:hypothetical protein